MLPTNVVSFVRKMVASDGGVTTSGMPSGGSTGSASSSQNRSDGSESTTALSKLKHTLTSGIQGTVTKLSPTRPPSSSTHDSGISSSTSSLSSSTQGAISSTSISSTSVVSVEERSLLQKVWDKSERYDPPETRVVTKPPPISTPTAPLGGTFSSLTPSLNGGSHTGNGSGLGLPGKPLRPPGSRCRVCVKTISEAEDYRRCSECSQKVCEDCASYSAKDAKEDKWHCSICKRKLLSRAKKDVPEVQTEPTSLSITLPETGSMTPLAPPSPGAPTALSLMSGFASMASSLTSSNAPVNPTSMPRGSITTSATAKPGSENGMDGWKNDSRRHSRAKPLIEKPTTKESYKEYRRPSTSKRNKEAPPKDRPPFVRRRSENEDESKKPKADGAHRGHRASDYMISDLSDEYKQAFSSKPKSDNDNLRSTKPRIQEQSKPVISADSNLGSVESSGDESSERKGRRRSIVRQQSYDEDTEDGSYLSIWSSGQLPARRHSSQDPSRRIEIDFQRSKELSLDVPQGKVQRHHSWDYDIARGPNQGRDTLLPNVIPAQSSRFSSESDVSNDSISERGSMVALQMDQRRPSRGSTTRRTSYRATKDLESNEDYPDSTPKDTGHAAPVGGGAQHKPGTSSLEDDPWLHPTEDEWKSTRRRSSAVSESGRVLPTPPTSPRISAYTSAGWNSCGSGGTCGARSSQSVESTSSRDLGDETGGRQNSVADGEAIIKIVIHDVDNDFRKGNQMAAAEDAGRRRIKIMREADDTRRGGGLGMRIVGGKAGSNGKMYAHVVWTVPGGPADCAGVRQGDKVIEWNGINLVDMNFEDVCSIIEADESKDIVEVLLEASSEPTTSDSRDEGVLAHSQRGSLEARGSLDSDLEKSLVSYSRRKLPKIPGDLHRSPVSGKVQVQMWFDKNNSSLITTVLSAHDLRARDGYAPPEAFVCLRLFPHSEGSMYSTPVAEPSSKPLWNSSFLFEALSGDALLGMTLELSAWDFINEAENGFLGECLIDLRHAYLDERPTWYRLQERRSRSANTTPRGSIAGYAEFPMPIVRRPSSVKSGSEDYYDGDDSRHSSVDSGLLHPDLAYSRSSSRRGSSVSEHAECEAYQLNRSYPHSLPQSRRSSFAHTSASPEFRAEDLEARLNIIPSAERRRAQSCRVTSQRELLQEAGWNMTYTPHWLSNSAVLYGGSAIMQGGFTSGPPSSSLNASRRSLSRSHSLKGDQKVIKGASKGQRGEEELQSWRANLGPGQVVPRAYRAILTDDFTLGEIRLELTQTRGHLEVEVSNARGLPAADSGQPPDTYVKTYLKDGDKKLYKRKTRVIRQSRTPNFYQTLRYPTQDVAGKTLLVMVWEKARGFDHNNGLGVAEIAVNKLQLRRPITGWYRLLPVSSVDRVEDSDSE